jgi:hypothetical protein
VVLIAGAVIVHTTTVSSILQHLVACTDHDLSVVQIVGTCKEK